MLIVQFAQGLNHLHANLHVPIKNLMNIYLGQNIQFSSFGIDDGSVNPVAVSKQCAFTKCTPGLHHIKQFKFIFNVNVYGYFATFYQVEGIGGVIPKKTTSFILYSRR
jgi:hypothetical protein